jgi:hypothetical protein
MRSISVFLLGFALASALFSVRLLTAQTPSVTLTDELTDYIVQLQEWIKRTENSYQVTTSYLFSFRGTNGQVVAASDALIKLEKDVLEVTPPVALLALHNQIAFAIKRCQNYAGRASTVQDVTKLTAFDASWIIPTREYCIVQIHAARLRLIDFGAEMGINALTLQKS